MSAAPPHAKRRTAAWIGPALLVLLGSASLFLGAPLSLGEPAPVSEPGVPGDVDGDGDLDLEDRTALVQCFGLRAGDPGWREAADLDRDGIVTFADYQAWIEVHEARRPVAASPPPAETGCGWLGPEAMAVALAWVPGRRRPPAPRVTPPMDERRPPCSPDPA